MPREPVHLVPIAVTANLEDRGRLAAWSARTPVGSGKRWKVATFRGIPLYVSTSWTFIVVFFVWSQYANLIHTGRAGEAEAFVLSVVAAALFFGSVLVHEGAHAVMARGLDLPVMGITLVFWGGATETKASGRGAIGEFLVAFVGPASTLVMAGVFWVVAQMTEGAASYVVGWLAWVSLLFAGLNSLPAFPLDGGRMFLAAVWGVTGNRRTAMRAAGYVGLAIGIATAAAAVVSFQNGDGYYLFLGYLAFIMIATGRSMEGRIAFRDQLVQGRVADAMRPPPRAVPADLSLAEALDRYLRGAGDGWFPVVENGVVVGTVSMATAGRVGSRDPLRPTRDGMAPIVQTPVCDPDETLDEAVEWLGGREGLVLSDGALVGALGPSDIERWYRRVVEGRFDPDTAAVGVPPRPDR
jgi:Zn-dependent protease